MKYERSTLIARWCVLLCHGFAATGRAGTDKRYGDRFCSERGSLANLVRDDDLSRRSRRSGPGLEPFSFDLDCP